MKEATKIKFNKCCKKQVSHNDEIILDLPYFSKEKFLRPIKVLSRTEKFVRSTKDSYKERRSASTKNGCGPTTARDLRYRWIKQATAEANAKN